MRGLTTSDDPKVDDFWSGVACMQDEINTEQMYERAEQQRDAMREDGIVVSRVWTCTSCNKRTTYWSVCEACENKLINSEVNY